MPRHQESSSSRQQHPAPQQSFPIIQQSYPIIQQSYHAPQQPDPPSYQPPGHNHPPHYTHGGPNVVTNTVFTTTTTQPMQLVPLQMVSVDRRNQRFLHYRSKDAAILGCLQILFGLITICVQLLVTISKHQGHDVFSGIWAPGLFILAGAFGMHSSKTKSECSVALTILFSIISALLAAGPVTQGSIGLHEALNNYHCSRTIDSITGITDKNCSHTIITAAAALFSIMLIIGLAEFVVAIIASAICCHGYCCYSELELTGQVPFHPGYIVTSGMQTTAFTH